MKQNLIEKGKISNQSIEQVTKENHIKQIVVLIKPSQIQDSQRTNILHNIVPLNNDSQNELNNLAEKVDHEINSEINNIKNDG